MKVLFVNDSEDFLRLNRELFSNNPEVCFAKCHTVDDVIRAIRDHQPDVVLLDHHLTANMDCHEGLEAYAEMKKLGLTKGRKFYTTTSDYSVLDLWKQFGIEKADHTIIRAVLVRDHARIYPEFLATHHASL